MFDLIDSPHDASGLSNVATIIGDLLHGEKLSPNALTMVAHLYTSAMATANAINAGT